MAYINNLLPNTYYFFKVSHSVAQAFTSVVYGIEHVVWVQVGPDLMSQPWVNTAQRPWARRLVRPKAETKGLVQPGHKPRVQPRHKPRALFLLHHRYIRVFYRQCLRLLMMN